MLIKVICVLSVLLNVILFLIVGWFATKVDDKASKVGFAIMEIAYLLSIVGVLF